MRRLVLLLLAALLVAAPHARAAFHLWAMTELYSNADGSVQFLELTAITGSQQFVGGHTLRASSGGTTRSFTFPANLPGDSAGRQMLVGTQGFAALGVVMPDYVVPNGFFFQGGGTIDFAGSSDVWNHPATPTDGQLSLNRNGSTGVNSPTNFAGQTGTVAPPPPPPPPPPQPALNFQALWWAAPAGSESGWGLNITHQGDTLFATWFTYDAQGPMWLVMSNGERVGDRSYTGTLFRTTGPAFDVPSFDPSRVMVTPVGNASFTFTDESNGTFTYSVSGVTQTKAIVRQVFAHPVSVCSAGSTPGAGNFQDLWWRSPAGSESGWGVNLTHQGDVLFATWFTYGSDGRGMWLVMSEGRRTTGNTFTGALHRTSGPAFNAMPWNPAQVTVTQVGTATFSFTDATNGTFTYTVGGVTQSKPITRQVFSSPASACRAGP